jgi:hypothetical protein
VVRSAFRELVDRAPVVDGPGWCGDGMGAEKSLKAEKLKS